MRLDKFSVISQFFTPNSMYSLIQPYIYFQAVPDEIYCERFEEENFSQNLTMPEGNLSACDVGCTTFGYSFKNNWTRASVATDYALVCEQKSTVHDLNSLGFLGFFCCNLWVRKTLTSSTLILITQSQNLNNLKNNARMSD